MQMLTAAHCEQGFLSCEGYVNMACRQGPSCCNGYEVPVFELR